MKFKLAFLSQRFFPVLPCPTSFSNKPFLSVTKILQTLVYPILLSIFTPHESSQVEAPTGCIHLQGSIPRKLGSVHKHHLNTRQNAVRGHVRRRHMCDNDLWCDCCLKSNLSCRLLCQLFNASWKAIPHPRVRNSVPLYQCSTWSWVTSSNSQGLLPQEKCHNYINRLACLSYSKQIKETYSKLH